MIQRILSTLLTSTLILAQTTSHAAPVALVIDASVVDHTISPLFNGCHVDQGYAHSNRGFYSQMIYGEIFEPTPMKVNAWTDVITGDAVGTATIDPSTLFNNNPTLRINYVSGTSGGASTVGKANRGLGNAGLTWVGNKGYSGYVYVQAEGGTSITIALFDTVTGITQDTSTILSPPGGGFHRYDFTLGPGSNTTCVPIAVGSDPTVECGKLGASDFTCQKCSGEVQVTLSSPGVANIGYIFLSPGAWGTFKGLPVRADTMATMAQMGINAIRLGGTYARDIFWKDYRGPSAFRPSNGHVWNDCLISGWGLFDAIDAFAAAGIEPIITLSKDQPGVDDWADLVDYVWSNSSTTWGAQRFADGHPDPYPVSIFELGNEEYNENFVAQVISMEARAAVIGRAGQMTYMFPSNNGLSSSDLAKAAAAGLPMQRIGADIHVGAGGGIAAAEAVFAANPQYNTSAGNFETNADYPASPSGQHGQVRAIAEATDLNTWMSTPAIIANRLIARTASFCNGYDANFDDFDQAISFFNKGQTWLQPPGWVHAMNTATPADQALSVTSTDTTSLLSVSSQRTVAGDHLYVRVANGASVSVDVSVTINGWTAGESVSLWTLVSALPNGGNSVNNTMAVAPIESTIPNFAPGSTLTLPSMSYSILGFVPAAAV